MSAHHSSLDPHPEFERLRRAMRRCRPMAGPWSGDLFRSARPEYANGRDLLSGEGAKRNGARWTPPGRFEAVYGSLDPETALVEALDHFRRYGFPASQAMPRVFVALAAELALALDLTRGEVRRRLRLSESRMRQEDWRARQRADKEAVTQAAGRAACDLGLEALIVPSAPVSGAANLVIFPSNLKETSRLLLLPRGLPA